MNFSAEFIDYESTGFFSKIVTDYINGRSQLKPFYQHEVSIDGIKAAIAERKKSQTNRTVLVQEIKKQYETIEVNPSVQNNINKLLDEHTFTVTTAHQPNIFTGPLYFIYKILHAIKLSEYLNTQIPDYHFVPVYYMGSEDADLEELGHVFIDDKRYVWQTNQKGAVGRMKVDQSLIGIIDGIEGQLAVHPFGNEIIKVLKQCYQTGVTIEEASFKFVHHLFAKYGLVVLLPDNPNLKRLFASVIKSEMDTQFSRSLVEETIAVFPQEYKVQAKGREINLFYLKDDLREKIELIHGKWSINHEVWTKDKLLHELELYPERFSPNVILRPVFQEMMLPNVVFIGGGSEIAYWLELKKIFEAVQVPYPVLVLRNSFLFVDKDINKLIGNLGFSVKDLFRKDIDLINDLVKRNSSLQLNVEQEKEQLLQLYKKIIEIAGRVDVTLEKHVAALQEKALYKLEALEKKMLRAERKKFEAQQRQIRNAKVRLFPQNSLQERIENFLPYYAKYGSTFLDTIFQYSTPLQQQFGIVKEA